jgi:hypothetical protein
MVYLQDVFMKTILSRLMSKQIVLAGVLLCILSGWADGAHAAARQKFSESPECVTLLRAGVKTLFRGPADEINYTNRYIGCWSESVIFNAKSPRYSQLGKGLEIFSNPAFLEAAGFSKLLCYGARAMQRNDYPCWFEMETAKQGVSVEEAARKEAPKILFTNQFTGRDGSDLVELVLCLNDDPTKPKEYSKGCSRGRKMHISEFGRGDFNGDSVDDMLVRIKYGNNDNDRKKCFMAGFTRKSGELFKMISYSPLGLCE